MKKIKRYRLSISRTFPATHNRKGEKTHFVDSIFSALKQNIPCDHCSYGISECGNHCFYYLLQPMPKLHTIRANYSLWEKRIAEVQAGRAVIEPYYWIGKPYNSSQVVFATLDKDSGIEIQKLFIYPDETSNIWNSDGISSGKYPVVKFWDELAKNDGLSLEDFKEWFKKYDRHLPLAIIQFTNFRY